MECIVFYSILNSIFNLYGEEGRINVQGELVKKLDVLANVVFIDFLRRSTVVSLIVSEEEKEAIHFPEYPESKYCVAFDPLDGSSNTDVNLTIGTIFSIFQKHGSSDKATTEKDILQPGKVFFFLIVCIFIIF